MAVIVKHISLWRKVVENKTGGLAQTLEPFAKAGADLQVVMGYRYSGAETTAAFEVYPVAGRKSAAAAEAAGLTASSLPALLVQGDDKTGLAYSIAQAIADAGVDMSFFVAQAIGRRYTAVIGFTNEVDAKKAAALIKKVAARL